MDAAQFFAGLFERPDPEQGINENALMVIWTLPDKRARFFDSTQAAADYAMGRAEDYDVYFGVGLYRPGIKRGRGKAADVVGITCLWADIDYGSSGRRRLPPTQADALNIVHAIGPKATYIVGSGHGYHPYWGLTDMLTADAGAAAVADRWAKTIQARAQGLGYAVDNVGDLSRVLRVPGTVNHKASESTAPPSKKEVLSGQPETGKKCAQRSDFRLVVEVVKHHMECFYELESLDMVMVAPAVVVDK